jgi:pimeloyl-ACP methyl ester carboxylesterase
MDAMTVQPAPAPDIPVAAWYGAPAMRGGVCFFAIVLAAGCGRSGAPPGSGPDAAAPEAGSSAELPADVPGRTPLSLAESVIDLPVAGFLPAVATLPAGSSGRRPVAVAVHGLSDGPQWACPLWRGVLGGGVFILCPRGVREHDQPRHVTPGTTYYGFTTWEALDAEIEAGLAALRERFPGRLDEGPPLYVGFSIGARLGVSLAVEHPGRYPRLLLSEGGHDAWTAATIRRFVEGHGERVLFACGDMACVAEAKPKAALLEQAGVQTKLVYGAGSRHEPYGPIFDETRKAIGWLVEGDPRWASR